MLILGAEEERTSLIAEPKLVPPEAGTVQQFHGHPSKQCAPSAAVERDDGDTILWTHQVVQDVNG